MLDHLPVLPILIPLLAGIILLFPLINMEAAQVNDEVNLISKTVRFFSFSDYSVQVVVMGVIFMGVGCGLMGGFVVTRTDITERKKAEFAEREGDLLVRTVLDASSAVVIMARTGDGQILYRSPAALTLFGNTKSAREHYEIASERADFVTQMLADLAKPPENIDQLAKTPT